MYRCLRTIHDQYGNRHENGSVIDPSQFREKHLNNLIRKGYLELLDEYKPKEYSEEIKICFVTGMWKRPEVFKIFGNHYKKLGIDVIVAGSEGKKSKKLAESFGFIYLERPNQPLSNKMNATTIEAMKRGYTHVICVGSDDLLTKDLVDEYIRLIKRGYDFIGLLDFYFYDLESGKASYWGGYRERYRFGHTVGAGRMLSAKLIKSWGGIVWDNTRPRHLDTSMQKRLSASPMPKYTFKLKDKGFLAVDVKSPENMTPFELWDNSSYIDAKIIESNFNVRNSGSNKRKR